MQKLTEKLEKVVELSRKTESVFIATADCAGTPHIAAAGKMHLTDDGYIALTQWFCYVTMTNLESNKNVSIAVWDKNTDTGYQVLGRSEKIKELHVLNGYAPELEPQPPLPQVERQLLIKPQGITDFKLAPHTDQPI